MTDDDKHIGVLLKLLHEWSREMREYLRDERERSYRRALEATGHTPGSVEIMLAKDREWIESGDEA